MSTSEDELIKVLKAKASRARILLDEENSEDVYQVWKDVVTVIGDDKARIVRLLRMLNDEELDWISGAIEDIYFRLGSDRMFLSHLCEIAATLPENNDFKYEVERLSALPSNQHNSVDII